MFKWEEETYKYIKNDSIFKKLKEYVSLLLEENKKMNLTSFDEEKIWCDGIYQSIFILNKFIDIESNVNLLDIGAGAGFPSIPFYIFSSDKIFLTIYEPIKKRVNFLNMIKEKLNLKNIKIINDRIENSKEKEFFNYVCARAVMNLNMLIEVSSKCGSIDCKYIFLKSKNIYEELNHSQWIINQLKIDNLKINPIDLNDGREHNIVTYNKTKSTPLNFPRKWSEIKKSNKIFTNDK